MSSLVSLNLTTIIAGLLSTFKASLQGDLIRLSEAIKQYVLFWENVNGKTWVFVFARCSFSSNLPSLFGSASCVGGQSISFRFSSLRRE